MSSTVTSTRLPTGTWTIDPAHTRVQFRASHLGIAPVRGTFREFAGALELGGDLAAARASGSVSVASLDTGNERRDAHLRSAAFLDAERFPTLTFASSEVRPLDGGTFEIAGALTLHGVTRPITLTAELGATEPDPSGRRRLTLAVAGRLKRADYGMTSLKVLVANEVELRLDISAVEEA